MKWNAQGVRINGARAPRFGGAEVVNVFAWRETDSRCLVHLMEVDVDVVGPENDEAIAVAWCSAVGDGLA